MEPLAVQPLPLHSLVWWAYAGLLALAAASDAARYRIPNWLVLLLLIGALALILARLPHELMPHAATGLAGLGIGFLLYAVAGLGAGDAKLLAVVLFWAGPGAIAPLVFWLGVASAVLVILLLGGRALAPRLAGGRSLWKPLRRHAPVPFALAISPGAIMASGAFPPAFW